MRMIIYFDPDGSATGLDRCLRQAAGQDNVSGLLVLCCAGNNFEAEQVDPLLRKVGLPLAGGIFPAIIHHGRKYETGTLVIGLPDIVTIETIHGLSDPDTDFESILDRKMPDSSRVRTLILFVDGFATCLSSFVASLFNVFGLDINYVGGGAGSLSMERKPYILTNSGMFKDAAVLIFLQTPSGIGVCHGWQELSGPYQVTEADGSVIHTIEWQPAFEFYRDMLAGLTGVRVTREHFYDTARNYPFGIARLSGEQIVRDPYQVEPDSSLTCVGDIQEGAFLSILQADEKNLIEAAAESLRLSLQALPPGMAGGLCFFVDCISRAIVLNENFQQEIDAVSLAGLPLVGICSVGEIANCGTEYLDIYNKTSVMAVLAGK